MRLKVSKVVDVRNKLLSLRDKDMAALLAFRLMRAFKPVREAAEQFDEAQSAVLRRHGQPSPDRPGTFVFVDDKGGFSREKFDAYEAEMKPLLDTEVELPDGEKFTQQDFERLQLSVNEVEALELFVA